ncbi:MAG TPA: ferredoxin family protein [Sedimentisphaerales bacterium]|nr:ferredoxin family protein [Sedimentisphaerales bacterium]
MVDDLCGLAAERDPCLQAWAQAPSLTVVACFPRTIRWLFHAAGVQLDQDRTRFLNMRSQSVEEITRELAGESKSASSVSNYQSSINDKSDWVPWFPVIDYDRCVNCKQCMNFCLFGTYGLSDEGHVQVVKPSGCKTNCPACARMCPKQAIIFPKYADSPINGDVVGATPRGCPAPDGQPAGQAQGPAPTGDLYDRIRNRSACGKRFSIQPQEVTGVQRVEGVPPSNRGQDARDTAKPNRSCPTLDSLKRELNIPDEVLASLSPTEMQRVLSKSKADTQEKGDKPHE